MPQTLADAPAAEPHEYSIRAASVDERAIASEPVRGAYAAIENALAASSLEALDAQAQRTMRDLGVTFNLYAEKERDRIVRFDAFPRVLDSAEWERLSRGAQQRAAVWNAFFRDIYSGTQEALKAGIVPFEIVYSDPAYLRAAVGVKVPGDVYVHAAAFDLARDARGDWMVIDDHVSQTTGASYALQARSVLSQVKPDLFRLADVQPVNGFASELLEHLRGCAQSGSGEPRVVALSSGDYNSAYYEDSWLARQMGIPLVRGGDLIVLNARVYLKTIAGLEPIDVIYRRMNDAAIDPLALSREEFIGVPGLLSCVRKGSVSIANALGAGLGDNRALAAHLPRLAKFYLNEPLQIPGVERLLCVDPDQCDQVLADPRRYFITTVTNRPGQPVWRTVNLSDGELNTLRENISANPAGFVAEPCMPLDLLPTCAPGFEPRHAGLRVFALTGKKSASAHPCALTRVASEPGSRIISTGLGGGIKDTWVLRGAPEPAPRAEIFSPAPQRRLRLGSRIAESLYWMGRYAERAENTTRILKTLHTLQSEAHRDERAWAPLWEALARATGHPTNFFKRSTAKKRSVGFYILLDRENRTSVLSCIERCRANAQGTREAVAPEVWSAIDRARSVLANALSISQKEIAGAPVEKLIELQDDVLNQLDAVSGAVEQHMLRDNGWQFWQLGVHIERAITTVLVMRQVFLKREGERPAAEQIDVNLDALLRMLASLYAYRSLFQTRPVFQNVAAMLLQDAQAPHSVFYCVDVLDRTLAAVFQNAAADNSFAPARQCMQLKAEITCLELARYFEPAANDGAKRKQQPELARLFEEIEAKLDALATAISDHYLYHQAINILR